MWLTDLSDSDLGKLTPLLISLSVHCHFFCKNMPKKGVVGAISVKLEKD